MLPGYTRPRNHGLARIARLLAAHPALLRKADSLQCYVREKPADTSAVLALNGMTLARKGRSRGRELVAQQHQIVRRSSASCTAALGPANADVMLCRTAESSMYTCPLLF